MVGLLLTEPGEDLPKPADFPGCIDVDPLAVSLSAQDSRLQGRSPCNDAGDYGPLAPAALGLDGNLRQFDDPFTSDTGLGMSPLVDVSGSEFGTLRRCCPSRSLVAWLLAEQGGS